MIPLHRLNGSEFWINPDEIFRAEAMPDTTITLRSGEKLLVRETPQVISGLIVAFRARIHSEAWRLDHTQDGDRSSGN